MYTTPPSYKDDTGVVVQPRRQVKGSVGTTRKKIPTRQGSKNSSEPSYSVTNYTKSPVFSSKNLETINELRSQLTRNREGVLTPLLLVVEKKNPRCIEGASYIRKKDVYHFHIKRGFGQENNTETVPVEIQIEEKESLNRGDRRPPNFKVTVKSRKKKQCTRGLRHSQVDQTSRYLNYEVCLKRSSHQQDHLSNYGSQRMRRQTTLKKTMDLRSSKPRGSTDVRPVTWESFTLNHSKRGTKTFNCLKHFPLPPSGRNQGLRKYVTTRNPFVC